MNSKEIDSSCKTLEYNGLTVDVYLSSEKENTIVVDIDTTALNRKFQFRNGVPKLRVFVNDECSDIKENGGWKVKKYVT